MFTKDDIKILNEALKYHEEKTKKALDITLKEDGVTKEELEELNKVVNIYEEKCTKALEASVNNKNLMVANNKKQKRVWLLQNKIRKLIKETSMF